MTHMHAVLAMAWRLSHVHNWHLAVTPPPSVVYVVFRLFPHIVYIGIIIAAPIRTLRNHMTNTLSSNACVTLHIY